MFWRFFYVSAICFAASVAFADGSPESDEVLIDPDSIIEKLMLMNDGRAVYQSCCKTCRKGQACGDSCISRSKSCNAGRGCACQG